MTYETEVANNNQFTTNVVAVIDGVTYAKYEPDSGLVVPDSNLIISTVSFNKTKINLKKSGSQISKVKITVLDLDEIFTTAIGAQEGALIGKDVVVSVGRMTGSFDFALYKKTKTFEIRDIVKNGNFYNLDCVAKTEKMQTPVFDAVGTLDSSITDSGTTITFQTPDDVFQATGAIKIGNEFISYVTKTFLSGITTLTGATRGAFSSTAAAHNSGSDVDEVFSIEGNPVDILLKALISSGGGGAYDVLHDGAGIDESLIDVAGFEQVRDDFLAADVFRLRFYNIENLLKFIEKEILEARNLRLVQRNEDDKIGLAILNQSNVDEIVPELNPSNTLKNPSWKLSSRELQNIVTIKWNWIDGLQKTTRISTFRDEDSITKYGEKKGRILTFKGIRADLDGTSIVTDIAALWLDRFATPRAEISASAFMSTSLLNPGDKVRLISDELPSEGGGLGMDSVVEILAAAINWSTGVVKHDLVFTSYSNLRRGLIQPTPALSLAIASQKEFTVPDGACYAIGYKMVLWDNANNKFFPDAINTIESVTGDVITMENDFTTILGANTNLEFADFDNSSANQKTRYAYNAPDSGFFADGSKAYEIYI